MSAPDYRSDLIGKLDQSAPGDVGPRLRAIESAFKLDPLTDDDEAGAYRGALTNELRAAGWMWRDSGVRAAQAIPDPPGDADGGEDLACDGAAWVEKHLLPPVDELIPDAPGLAYRGLATLAHADRGTGKTLYSVWLATAALRAGLRVLVAVDDDPSTWARRLADWCPPLAKLYPLDMAVLAPVGAFERAVARYEPDVVIVDSWRRWSRANGATKRGDANDESVAGPIADRLVDVATSGPAVVILANEAKSSEGNTSRGSVAPEDGMTGSVRRISRDGDITSIETSGKVRDGVPAGPWRMRLSADGYRRVDWTDDPGPDDGGGGGGGGREEAADDLLRETPATSVRSFRKAMRMAGHGANNATLDATLIAWGGSRRQYQLCRRGECRGCCTTASTSTASAWAQNLSGRYRADGEKFGLLQHCSRRCLLFVRGIAVPSQHAFHENAEFRPDVFP